MLMMAATVVHVRAEIYYPKKVRFIACFILLVIAPLASVDIVTSSVITRLCLLVRWLVGSFVRYACDGDFSNSISPIFVKICESSSESQK